MEGVVHLAIILQSLVLAVATQTPLTPTNFNFSTLGVLAANGSSAVGGCSNVTLHLNGRSTCNDPSSSVLFDGNIPTLAALDGDTWARQLMILYTPEFGSPSFNIDSGFVTSTNRRVEVTIFNCPQWGTGVRYISVHYRYSYSYSYSHIGFAYPTVISCTSLLRVCIPFDNTGTKLRLQFNRYSGVQYVHIAEIAFYSNSTPCPPFTTIPGTWLDNATGQSTSLYPGTGAQRENGVEGAFQGQSERSSTILTVLSLLVAIMTLQTTVIFIVAVVIACRRNGRGAVARGGHNTNTNAEEQVCKVVDKEEKFKTPKISSGRHGGESEAIHFKKNESYTLTRDFKK